MSKFELLVETPFKEETNPSYKGKTFQVRKVGTQTRFYEVDKARKKEVCLKKDTVVWLFKHRRIARTREIKQLIFNR